MMTGTENITIYSADGVAKIATPINEGCKRKVELMKEDYVTVKFSLVQSVDLRIGDYCDTAYGRFVLTEPYQPKYNKETGAYDYDVQLNADYYLWNNKLFKYRPENGAQEAAFTLTSTIETFVRLVQQNITANGYKYPLESGETNYTVGYDGTVATDMKTVSFSSVGIIDATTQIAEAFECEWWFVGYQLHFGRCEQGAPIELEQGKNLVSMEASASKQKYANRLYVFGGTTNIPPRYRKNLIFDVKSRSGEGKNIEDTSRPINATMFPNEAIVYDDVLALTPKGISEQTFIWSEQTPNAIIEDEIQTSHAYKGKYSFVSMGGEYKAARISGESLICQWRLVVDFNDGEEDRTEAVWTSESVNGDSVLTLPENLSWYNPADGMVRLRLQLLVSCAAGFGSTNTVTYSVTNNADHTIVMRGSYPSANVNLTFISGILAGESVKGVLNESRTPDTVNTITLEERADSKVPAVGDRFKIDNILASVVPVGYFTSLQDGDLTINGITERRLMLPEAYGATCIELADFDADGNLIIDRDNNTNPRIPESEIVEGILVSDEVYPHMSDSEVTNVVSYTETKTDDMDVDIPYVNYLIETNINWDERYRIEGEELTVRFVTGSLAGLSFAVEYRKSGTTINNADNDLTVQNDAFEIIFDENLQLPSTISKPKAGDKFVLNGWDTSFMNELGLVSTAENELAVVGRDYLRKSAVDPNTYTCVPFFDNLIGDDTLDLQLGRRVTLINDVFFDEGKRESRVIGYEFSLDIPYDKPQYIVGEKAEYSRLGDIEDSIKDIQVNGLSYQKQNVNISGSHGGSSVYILKSGDSVAASEDNVYSAKRSDDTFINKTKDDRTEHSLGIGKDLTVDGNTSTIGATITNTIQVNQTATIDGSTMMNGNAYANQGMTFGTFSSDILQGTGARIDAAGAGELDSLTVRKELIVPTLTYNRVDINVGHQWRAPGGGVIDSVEVISDKTGTITLRLEEGEIGKISASDLCMGIFHNLDPNSNDTVDSDDGKGNFTFAGFSTVYFKINEVFDTESKNASADYTLRSGYTNHPQPNMTFVCFGNDDEKKKDRQSSRYSTLTYERYLRKVTTWEINARNIAAQFGDLSNLEMLGIDTEEYSTYLSDIYFTGKIEQLDQAIIDALDNKGYTVELTKYTDDIEVGYDGYGNLFSADTSGNITYRLSTAVTARKGSNILRLAEGTEPAEGEYSLSVQPNGCTVIQSNSTIYITKVEGLHDGVSDADYDEEAMKAVVGCGFDIVVNLEGRQTIIKSVHIAIKHRGEKGVSSFKSTAFMRSVTQPVSEESPWGGSWDKPIPESTIPDGSGRLFWSDGIPEGDDPIWMTSRVFYSDGSHDTTNKTDWTAPAMLADTPDIDVAYHEGETYQALPTKHHVVNQGNGWTNKATVDTIWMAIDRKKNGNWTGWKVSRIKGEKGEDGTSIKVAGTIEDLGELPYPGDAGFDASDAYIWSENGHLYVWDGEQWTDAGPFRGEKGDNGKTAYVHIKYSAFQTGYDDDNNAAMSEKPNKYIGIYSDDDELDSDTPSDYQWSKFKGDDGFGYEYIYLRTTTSIAPDTPKDVDQKDNYTPKVDEHQWTDSPTGVDATYKYEWMCYRNKVDGLWGAFVGSASDKTKAALWAKYAEDGNNGKQGAIMRVREYSSVDGTEYTSGNGEGEEFLDVVMFTKEIGGIQKSAFYQCIKSYEVKASSPIDPTDKEYWKEFSNFFPVATKILLAEHAYIKNLGATSIRVYKDGNPEKGIAFEVDEYGDLTCNTGTFTDVNVRGTLEASTLKMSVCEPYKGDLTADADNVTVSPTFEYWNGAMYGNAMVGNCIVHGQETQNFVLPTLQPGEMRDIIIMNRPYYIRGEVPPIVFYTERPLSPNSISTWEGKGAVISDAQAEILSQWMNPTLVYFNHNGLSGSNTEGTSFDVTLSAIMRTYHLYGMRSTVMDSGTEKDVTVWLLDDEGSSVISHHQELDTALTEEHLTDMCNYLTSLTNGE